MAVFWYFHFFNFKSHVLSRFNGTIKDKLGLVTYDPEDGVDTIKHNFNMRLDILIRTKLGNFVHIISKNLLDLLKLIRSRLFGTNRGINNNFHFVVNFNNEFCDLLKILFCDFTCGSLEFLNHLIKFSKGWCCSLATFRCRSYTS